MNEGNYTRNLVIGFLIIISLLIMGSLYTIKIIDYFTKQSTNIYNHPYTVSNTVRDIKIKLFEIEVEIRDDLLLNKKKDLTDITTFIIIKEQSIIKDLNILNNRYLGDKKDIEDFENALNSLTQTRLKILSLARANNIEEALLLNDTVEKDQLKKVTQSLKVIMQFANTKGKSYFDDIQNVSTFTFNITVALVCLSVFFSFIISMYIINITKQKEEKIKRYFHMIEKNILSLVFNLDGNIVESSKALSLFLGTQKEELLNKKIDIIIHDEAKRKDLLLTITNGFDWEDELEFENDIWLSIKVSPSLYDNKTSPKYSMILHDISDKKRIEYNSNIDQLTKLYNRRFFDDIIPKLLKQLNRNESFAIFIMIDIDYFKQYNDFYGHPQGDEALKAVAYTLKENINRANDYVFRLGGEEFGVFIECKSLENAEAFLKRLKFAVLALKINHNESLINEYLSISMGAVLIDNAYNLEIEDIYKKADKLLYKAKEEGRNRFFIEKI